MFDTVALHTSSVFMKHFQAELTFLEWEHSQDFTLEGYEC